MAWVRIEFTVEPFTEGFLGPHVTAALEVLRERGFKPDVGPFGNAVSGEAAELFPAMCDAAVASFANNATGLAVTARAPRERSEGSEDFLASMGPVAQAMGAKVIDIEDMGPDDVPLVWRGEVVGGLHAQVSLGNLRESLGVLVSQVETEVGGPLAELPRAAKQRAVRILDERGAFFLRNAVDEVADVMGVSRVTVYNYLNATRGTPAASSSSTGHEPATT